MSEYNYVPVKCRMRECNNDVFVPPWYAPFSDYCDEHKDEAKEHVAEGYYAPDGAFENDSRGLHE